MCVSHIGLGLQEHGCSRVSSDEREISRVGSDEREISRVGSGEREISRVRDLSVGINRRQVFVHEV